jgi:hypothetical protein
MYMERILVQAIVLACKIMEALRRAKGDYLLFQMSCKFAALVDYNTCINFELLTTRNSQHRVSPFHLKDPTKPGHRRFIALWLVDPTQRIISTANVPPQQLDWWMDSVLGKTIADRKSALSHLPAEVVTLMRDKGLNVDLSATLEAKLPAELMEMVRGYFHADKNTLPMGLEEANDHRIKLMEARSAFVKTTENGWQRHTYSFCEH